METTTQKIGNEALLSSPLESGTDLLTIFKSAKRAMERYDSTHRTPILIAATLRAISLIECESGSDELVELKDFIMNLAVLIDQIESPKKVTYH